MGFNSGFKGLIKSDGGIDEFDGHFVRQVQLLVLCSSDLKLRIEYCSLFETFIR